MREDATTNRTRGRSASPVRLPPRPTRLIGREAEVAALQDLLLRDDIRLVTVTGPPGVGKTRLAIEVAALAAGQFGNGVAFVDLSGTSDVHLVPFALAQQLGIREVEQGATATGIPIAERITDFLREKELLVVLDNFEQVVAAAPFVGDILAACSDLKIVATSRIPLHLLWEHELPLDPLPVADTRGVTAAPAVALFVERARAHKPDFSLNADNASIISQICARVDGLPLGIELAAAHIRHLPPAALLQKLERRLETLTGGPRDLPPRHRTLRAAIAWSYNLLPPHEQELFRKLSVFAGGFSIDATTAVCAGAVPDIFPGISALIDRHLVRQSSESVPEARFEILESLREYGEDQLSGAGEGEVTRQRHLAFFLQLVESASLGLRGHEQLEWLSRLDVDQNNIRAALGWAFEHEDTESALRMAIALPFYWNLRARFHEALTWLERCLSSEEDIPITLRTHALSEMGFCLFGVRGSLDRPRQMFEESLRLSRQHAGEGSVGKALALWGLARISSSVGDIEAGDRLRQESLELFRALGDEFWVAIILSEWGYRLAVHDRSEEAERALKEALSIGEQRGDRYALSRALKGFTVVAVRRGDFVGAERLQEKSLGLSRELGASAEVISSTNNLGVIAVEKGDYKVAKARFAEAFALAQQAGLLPAFANIVENLGEVEEYQNQYHRAAARYLEYRDLLDEREIEPGALDLEIAAGVAVGLGHAETAARLLGAAEARQEALTTSRPRYEMTRRLQKRRTDLIRATLGDERLATEWAAGRALHFEQALAEARRILDDAASAAVAQPPAPRIRRGPLSRREVEIAGLVAKGFSNREIGKRLFISERTADTHVQHILNKLSFNSRAQIAAWAVQQGLIPPAPNQ